MGLAQDLVQKMFGKTNYSYEGYFGRKTPTSHLNLSEATLRGFLLTGKFVKLAEAQTTTFTEKPAYEFGTRTAAPDFEEMTKAHLENGDVSFALDLHNAVIAGRGYHITAATPMIQDKAEDFAKAFRLREFSEIAVKESLGYGNTFFKYKTPENFLDLIWLSISTIRALNWAGDEIGNYEIIGHPDIPAQQMFHIPWRRINANPFGFGLIEALVSSSDYEVTRDGQVETRTKPPTMRIKAEMQDTGRKILQRYIPRHWIDLKGHGPMDTVATNFTAKLKTLEPEEDIISPIETNVNQLNQGVRALDWESWEKLFRNEIITTLENPAIRIFTEPGFTKANADAAIEAVKMLLQGFADYWQEIITNLIFRRWYETNPWIDANGTKLMWKEAKIGFSWGPIEQPKMESQTIVEYGKLLAQGWNGMKMTEWRRLARQNGVPLDEDDNVQPAPSAASLTQAAVSPLQQEIKALTEKMDRNTLYSQSIEKEKLDLIKLAKDKLGKV